MWLIAALCYVYILKKMLLMSKTIIYHMQSQFAFWKLLFKLQLSQQLQEKSDVVDQLEERVKLLQQREQDQALSGDERLVALQKEVYLTF